MGAGAPAGAIKHVILLMLENHSFDQMLGALQAVYSELDGIDPKLAANPNGRRSNVDLAGRTFYQRSTTERQMLLDPRHEVEHVAVQLKNNNAGFVKDFDASFSNAKPPCTDADKQFIMGYYPLDFLPALHALGRDFTVCDQWFSSVPGPTWPNRFFALTGTANGRVAMPGDGAHTVDLPGWFEQDQDTILDRLTEKGINWRIYFHDAPQSWVLSHQRRPENMARYFYINRFHADARGPADDFPAFSFIEPDFMGYDENDDHPPHDIMKAEKLIADIYNSLRANPDLWNSTLLVITYDEHGGFYDHVAPGTAVPPDNHHEEYSFDRLGVRVPALLISPWVKRGVVSKKFDHTSLLKYLVDAWGLRPLGERVAQANSIAVALISDRPRTDTCARIELTPDQLVPPNPALEEQAGEMETAHHRALAALWKYTKIELDEGVGRLVTPLARLFEFVKKAVEAVLRLLRGEAGKMAASPSQPDHISGKQGKSMVLHKHFADFLRHQKVKSVGVLAARIRDKTLPAEQRDHAVHALAGISGRKFHRPKGPALPGAKMAGQAGGTEDAIAAADAWLRRQGH